MSTLQLFDFEEHVVRSQMIDNELWFMGKDVCTCLEIANHNQALSRLAEDERLHGVCFTDPVRNDRLTIAVNEAGVYRLIFSSSKPSAERFRRWVLHDVLPQIRRTGRYVPEGEQTPPSPLSAQFALAGEPLNLMQTRIFFIREARQLFGIPRARKLWVMAGFPVLEEEEGRELPHSTQELDATACLEHLLSVNLAGHIVMDLIKEGDGSANGRLAKAGIRVLDDDGIAVATAAHMVAPIFQRSPWANGGHIVPLLALNGTARFKIMRFNATAARTILVPAATLYPNNASTATTVLNMA